MPAPTRHLAGERRSVRRHLAGVDEPADAELVEDALAELDRAGDRRLCHPSGCCRGIAARPTGSDSRAPWRCRRHRSAGRAAGRIDRRPERLADQAAQRDDAAVRSRSGRNRSRRKPGRARRSTSGRSSDWVGVTEKAARMPRVGSNRLSVLSNFAAAARPPGCSAAITPSWRSAPAPRSDRCRRSSAATACG